VTASPKKSLWKAKGGKWLSQELLYGGPPEEATSSFITQKKTSPQQRRKKKTRPTGVAVSEKIKQERKKDRAGRRYLQGAFKRMAFSLERGSSSWAGNCTLLLKRRGEKEEGGNLSWEAYRPCWERKVLDRPKRATETFTRGLRTSSLLTAEKRGGGLSVNGVPGKKGRNGGPPIKPQLRGG